MPEQLCAQLDAAIARATESLLGQRDERGVWVGHLSSGALSTATAAGALTLLDAPTHEPRIHMAMDWLEAHQNPDGGWGDTPQSPSNIATSLIAFATGAIAGRVGIQARHNSRDRALVYIRHHCYGGEAEGIVRALSQRYGGDRTFAAPILAYLAVAGVLGRGKEAWRHVPHLPFECALLPHRLLKWLGLPVVSYALPALIAVGQARHIHRPSRCPVTRPLRAILLTRTRRKLRAIQPDSGGYLEAAPLSSFVAAMLVSIGAGDDTACRRIETFLCDTMRTDGSWPIDTNLATWVTTLAVDALGEAGALPTIARETPLPWLLAQQHRRTHPYTQADPGGWAWTDLSGGVPDADDTAGALRAIDRLAEANKDEVLPAVRAAVDWLLKLQNADGGWPTFCRGWGKLPFDRSCVDITAHVLEALDTWASRLGTARRRGIHRANQMARRFLRRTRRADGAFEPLWFGNQHAPEEANAVFGSARVVRALAKSPTTDGMDDVINEAAGYLLSAQDEGGGWGGTHGVQPSVEETAHATWALAVLLEARPDAPAASRLADAVVQGCGWLLRETDGGRIFPAAPIGLYFASLWYAEAMYPHIFTLAALSSSRRALGGIVSADPGH